MNIVDLIRQYSQEKTDSTLHELYSAIRAQPTFASDTSIDAKLQPALTQRDHRRVIAIIMEETPGIYMSPGIHRIAANAYRAIGEDRTADFHDYFAQLAYEAIINSGDGSLAHPWHVIRVRDEYDVMAIEGYEVDKQELILRGGQTIDILTSGDIQRAFALDN